VPGAAEASWGPRRTLAIAASGALLAAALAAVVASTRGGVGPLPTFREQACALPREWLALTRRGYFEERSGHIALLPRTPAYMASGAGGWSHSGPWPYLSEVPLVFYGPGVVDSAGEIDRRATLADVAPTLAALVGGSLPGAAGRALPEVPAPAAPRPRLVVTVVWDGGGWNVLDRFPGAWPELRRLMTEGVSYGRASVGSSPSVTPAVHTTLGTGVFPAAHGITGVPVRDEEGEVVDSFLDGESARFLRVPALAERWDEAHGNRPEVGMVGYEPWHLGMIGMGAERPGGDRDDAAWLDIESNEWTTNERHYRLPPALPATGGLERDVMRTDAADGRVDGAWRDNEIIGDVARVEELPGFVHYHERALRNLISSEGYGDDGTTDLLFTNFKQIDRNGHYYNMDSPEVRDALVASDEALADLVDHLDGTVGRGGYALVVTADHGQQPDDSAIGGYGIDPNEVEADIAEEFGPIVRAVWPTEVFLLEDELAAAGVTVEEVARFLGDYRLRDNATRPDLAVGGAGRFDPEDRVFALAMPAAMLPDVRCPPGRPS
jgi:hypothetical protein